MREVRNSKGFLVCKINEFSGLIEILMKGCITMIQLTSDGEIKISNFQKTA